MSDPVEEPQLPVEPAIDLAPGRSCGECSLCCKLLAVKELAKPENQWCSHFKAGAGCTVYSTRPASCRHFYCGFMRRSDFGEEWRPSRSHFVLYWDFAGDRLFVHVDPAYPSAWREQPYYRQLKWMSRQVTEGRHIVVRVRDRMTVILPNKDVDLGDVEDGDVIRVFPAMTPQGKDFFAEKVPRERVSPDLAARAVSVLGPQSGKA